jgi:predicted phosphodiesterase
VRERRCKFYAMPPHRPRRRIRDLEARSTRVRIAVISDIHGNCVALDAVLADLRRRPADRLVCLGDAVQGGPQPVETVARLRELACPVVMGNADAWLLTGEETGAEGASAQLREVRAWSLAQLSDDDRAFMAGFQPTVEIALDGGRRLLCFHGSPRSFDDVLLPETPHEEFRRILGPFDAAALTGGHTHTQQLRRLGDAMFFNPGSVGFAFAHHQPDDDFHADPWAEYAVLTVEEERLALEFRRVPFDVAALIEVVRASGRPHADEAIARYRTRTEE